jgi:hypothetical protein
MQRAYLSTFTADNTDTFWACPIEGHKIPFSHKVGIKEDHKWEHVFADFYNQGDSGTK